MDRIVFDYIPIKFDTEEVLKFNKIRPNSSFREVFIEALSIAEKHLRCKAVLKWVNIEAIVGKTTTIDGVNFQSKVMADNLQDVKKAFLFVMTVGAEIDECKEIEENTLRDMIKGTALGYIHKFVLEYITEHFGYQDLAMMTPGSLPDWPIINNDDLFAMIGNVTEDIGVSLNKHHYMQPYNSSSGIIFSSSTGYVNCTLCKNLDCIGRHAPFDQAEYNRLFT
ncbi:MAG TPA: hypothetical protein VFC74_03605 [Oscillospiraceae bacterium]|nr:hypothetical protein [Oscillospiraceae bacterium]